MRNEGSVDDEEGEAEILERGKRFTWIATFASVAYLQLDCNAPSTFDNVPTSPCCGARESDRSERADYEENKNASSCPSRNNDPS